MLYSKKKCSSLPWFSFNSFAFFRENVFGEALKFNTEFNQMVTDGTLLGQEKPFLKQVYWTLVVISESECNCCQLWNNFLSILSSLPLFLIIPWIISWKTFCWAKMNLMMKTFTQNWSTTISPVKISFHHFDEKASFWNGPHIQCADSWIKEIIVHEA